MDILGEARRRAFSVWLRTGRLPDWARTRNSEVKYNPWHDPDDGRFTFAGTGRYFGRGGGGGGAVARMHERPSDGGRRPEPYGGFGGGESPGGGASGSYGKPVPESERGGREKHPPWWSAAEPAQATPSSVQRPVRRSPTDRRNWRVVEANGYEWRLDETGLFRELEGTLSFSDTPRRSRGAQSRAGGPDRRSTDDGGHYIAPRFNGPTEAFNHFAQDLNLNRGRYRVLEDQWDRAGRSGKRVDLKIEAIYEGSSRRPSYINVWFWIDGKRHSLQFPNEPLERSRDK